MIASAPLSTQASRTNENGLARRRSPSRRNSWKRAKSFQSALFKPIVEIGLGCAVATGDKLLGGTICQQAFDLGTIRMSLLFPGPGGLPSIIPCDFLKRNASLVRCEIRSRSISAAIEKAIAMILLWILWSRRQAPFDRIDVDPLLRSNREDLHTFQHTAAQAREFTDYDCIICL